MRDKVEMREVLGQIKVRFDCLEICANTLIDLMLALKKNDPENFESISFLLKEASERHQLKQ